MEDILKQLKKLQIIEANKRFTEQSRLLIMGAQKRRNVWDVILKNVELGASFALAGILIITILGGFSAWKLLSPFKLSNLDTTDLKAEAQAVDIQIQLTNLNYDEIAGAAESTAPSAEPSIPKTSEKTYTGNTSLSQQPKETSSTIATSSPSSDETLSIDEALEKLSE